MSDVTQRPFQTNKWDIIPADSRWVGEPIKGSSIRVISDLIPTAAITATWPVKNVTTYGDCPYINNAKPNPFESFIFSRLGEPFGQFTRAYFAQVITAAETLVPYKTTEYYDDAEWDPILEWYQFYQDASTAINATYVRENGGKATSVMPRFRVQIGWVDAQYKNTLHVRKHYLSNVTFGLKKQNHFAPQPTHVAWSLPGTTETLPKCLHGDVNIPAIPNYMRIVYEGGSAVVPTGSDGKMQVVPKTNAKTWIQHVISDIEVEHEDYFERVVTEISPPVKPKATKKLL